MAGVGGERGASRREGDVVLRNHPAKLIYCTFSLPAFFDVINKAFLVQVINLALLLLGISTSACTLEERRVHLR